MQILNADGVDFRKYLRESEPQHKVKAASLFVQDMIDDLGQDRHEVHSFLPWDKTHTLFHFRPGEVTVWCGVNGQGKSMMTGLTALSLCTQGEKVCIASFEMKPRKTLERMMRQWSGQAQPQAAEVKDPEILATFKDLYEQFRDWSGSLLWLYDQQGMADTEVLLGVIKYCANELKVRHFFVDSLMKCIAHEDDYNGQKVFVDQMTCIARETGIHIHLVHHMKKLPDEGKKPDKMDVKGSGSITDQVDNLLIVWRNKPKEKMMQAGKRPQDNEPDSMIFCEKQRNGTGWEGSISLWYDKESQQYLSSNTSKPMNMCNFPHWD